MKIVFPIKWPCLERKSIREHRVRLYARRPALPGQRPPPLPTALLFSSHSTGGGQLWPWWSSGLQPTSEPCPSQQGGLGASGPNEENLPFLLSEGQKGPQILPCDGKRQPGPKGPGHLCPPWDALAHLRPLAHRECLCCLEHHPPEPTVHRTLSVALIPGALFGAGDRGRNCPSILGLCTGHKEVLLGYLPLPEREEIQRLCLESCLSGNHKILDFNNNRARTVKK